jgi:hypothetical protein
MASALWRTGDRCPNPAASPSCKFRIIRARPAAATGRNAAVIRELREGIVLWKVPPSICFLHKNLISLRWCGANVPGWIWICLLHSCFLLRIWKSILHFKQAGQRDQHSLIILWWCRRSTCLLCESKIEAPVLEGFCASSIFSCYIDDFYAS